MNCVSAPSTLSKHVAMRMGVTHQRVVHVEKRNPYKRSMRDAFDICSSVRDVAARDRPCSEDRSSCHNRAWSVPTRRLDANLVPPVHDDPRKRGLRIRLQRGRQIDGLDALQMDALNCTVDFPSAAQSAASLIAVSKAFA